MRKCLCGKDAVAVAYLPLENVFSGLHQVMEAHDVCEYHGKKSEEKGFKVEWNK